MLNCRLYCMDQWLNDTVRLSRLQEPNNSIITLTCCKFTCEQAEV